MQMNVWMQHFNAVRVPFKHSGYLQGMSGDQLTACAAARHGQTLWELQWVSHAPQALPFKLRGTVNKFGTACRWMFQSNISMQCAPLKHSEYLQGMSGHQLTVCATADTAKVFGSCSGLTMRPKHFCQKVGGKCMCCYALMIECNISMQCAPLWNILNIYKEWMGTSWPYAQLQEAIITAKSFESCSGLAQAFPFTFAGTVW